jgi:hypothetical protein
MIVGKFICSACGRDCTHLYGFIMQKRTTLTRMQAEDFSNVDKEFGKSDFVFCWSCTAKAFGAKTLAEKEAERIVLEQQKPEESVTETATEAILSRGRGRPRKTEQENFET